MTFLFAGGRKQLGVHIKPPIELLSFNFFLLSNS